MCCLRGCQFLPQVALTPTPQYPTVYSITSNGRSRCQEGPLSDNLDGRIEAKSRRPLPYPRTLMEATRQGAHHSSSSTSNGVTHSSEDGGRKRGAFIVGYSAPVEIDQGIQVHLKAGADEEVDFII